MKIFTHIFTFVVGIAIAVIYFQSCNPTPAPQITTVIKRDTVTEYIYVPVVSGEGKSELKYTYSGMIHDTIIRNDSVFITLRDSVSFTAKLDTIQASDTLNLEFNYPSAMFSYRLSRSPIEIRYTNTVVTNTVTIPPRKLTIGVQAGAGFVQLLGGVGGVGVYGGVGIGYLLY
jgi:hypothetical protein